jgi:hypothetical protein
MLVYDRSCKAPHLNATKTDLQLERYPKTELL